MNGIGMATITAFYNLHLRDKHMRTVPGNMVPRAIRYFPERVCAPLCTPNNCPILFTFLTHDDTREVIISTRRSARYPDGIYTEVDDPTREE